MLSEAIADYKAFTYSRNHMSAISACQMCWKERCHAWVRAIYGGIIEPKVARVMHSLVYRRKTTMIVESEKTAQSTPRNTRPRFPPLAVVCNGFVVHCEAGFRAASILKTASARKGRGARRRTRGFMKVINSNWHRGGGHRHSLLRMAVQES